LVTLRLKVLGILILGERVTMLVLPWVFYFGYFEAEGF
jgi:hypothetical protein